jgi:hypothetical protein
MTSPQPKNVAASVHQRLRNHARLSGDDPQYVLMRYGLERLMYRLSQSRHAHLFTVKGALMFLVWAGEQYRPTKDLDLMTARRQSAEQLRTVFRDVCGTVVEPDGLSMTGDSVAVEEIREDTEYGGMRVTLSAMLGPARIPLQIDIGFGDAVTPKAREHAFPALLDLPAPRLPMYPRETAIHATFIRRKTPLPSDLPAGLSDEFAGDQMKQTQWTAFVRRTRFSKPVDASLKAVVEGIRTFLMPTTMAALESKAFSNRWPKGGPWRGAEKTK